MNKKLYQLALALLPLSAFAQPVITSVEDYQIGTSVKYVNCINNIGPGGAGANQHWMFTSLSPIDTVVDNVVTPDWTPYRSQHPDANIARRTKDGDYLFYNKTGNATYLVGDHDATANRHITHPNSLLSSKRPLTYNDVAIDTFTTKENTSGSSGMGIMNMQVDGYGMLHLPGNVTINDVIRIKVTLVSTDTIPFAPPPYPSPSRIITTSTLYSWFDNGHKSALLRWDSTAVLINGSGTPQIGKSMSYFLQEYPYNIENTLSIHNDPIATINGQTLILKNTFLAARKYEACIFNLNGQKLQEFSFTATGDKKELAINAPLPAGMYVILLKDNTIATPYILKAVKQ